MSFLKSIFSFGYPGKKDLEPLQSKDQKNRIQLLYDFERSINQVSIRSLEYDDYLDIKELYYNRLEEVRINFLNLKSAYKRSERNWKKPMKESKDFADNVYWAYANEMIRESGRRLILKTCNLNWHYTGKFLCF